MNRRWAGPGAGREGTGKRRVNTAATKTRETHTNSIPIITADHGQVLAKTGREHIQDTRTQQPHCQFDRTQLYKFVKTPERVSSNRNTHIYSDRSLQKINMLSLLNCMLFQTCMTFFLPWKIWNMTQIIRTTNYTFTVLLVILQLDNPDPNLPTINLPHGKWAVHYAACLLLWQNERRKSCGF